MSSAGLSERCFVAFMAWATLSGCSPSRQDEPLLVAQQALVPQLSPPFDIEAYPALSASLTANGILACGSQRCLGVYSGPAGFPLATRITADGSPVDLPRIHLAANLRLHFAALLPHFDAMAIHSGGIVRHGRAILFVAPNDGGKTTAVQLSQGCPILHDDQVILRRGGGMVHAHATPFGRLTDGPLSAKLGAFLVLKKSLKFFGMATPPSWKAYRERKGSGLLIYYRLRALKRQLFKWGFRRSLSTGTPWTRP